MKLAINAPPAHVYEFGDFRLDAGKRLLWRAGAQVPLTPRVFETLLYLVEHHDTVLDKERLMEAVWPDSIVEENNLTQNISTLRRVFGETPGSRQYIATVPGRGYRFVAKIKMSEADAGPEARRIPEAAIAPAEKKTEPGASVAQPENRHSFRPALLATAAVLALSVAALFFWRDRTQNPPEAPARTKSAKILLPEKSIAVLPFANLSADQENAFFTEGVQDDILTALAKFADLKVISRTSVASYAAGPHRNLREIGQELGVANILEGSVRRAGGKVRVTAQLIEMRTNTHLWAETYDRELADVFAIQSDIAQRIATALEAKLAPEEKARLDAKPTTNSEAYVLYVTARGTEDQIEAEKIYMQAIALDPGFALAYAQASILNSWFSVDDRARKAKARAQAEEALRLSPALGEAHMALGLCLFGGRRITTQRLRSSRSPRRLLPITPRSTFTLVASIAGRDAGANRLQASNAPCPSILATAASLSWRPTITFLCVTGPPLLPVSIARWRSSRISCFPRLALLTLKCFATAIPLRAENFRKHPCQR